jgi:hypothetical protein
VERLDTTAARALRMILRDQPNSEAKVDFAWKVAAGPALARATRVSWSSPGTMHVRAASDAWQREVMRARPVIAERLNLLLGPDVVRTITVVSDVPAIARRGPSSPN